MGEAAGLHLVRFEGVDFGFFLPTVRAVIFHDFLKLRVFFHASFFSLVPDGPFFFLICSDVSTGDHVFICPYFSAFGK